MKIGLVVYSQTGHTAMLADRLAERLSEQGRDVTVLPLLPVGEFSMSAERVPLASLPEVAHFDLVFIGTPVNGGRMSAPVRTFLEEVPAMDGLPVAFLLTHFFPRKWGAEQTIGALTALCSEKGATVLGSADVAWPSPFRRRRIEEAVDYLADLAKE